MAGVKENDRADAKAGKAILTSGLRLGKSEVLRSLRHYLRTRTLRHYTIDRLEERDEERGRVKRTRGVHRQPDEHWNCFKGNAGEMYDIIMGFYERINTILN